MISETTSSQHTMTGLSKLSFLYCLLVLLLPLDIINKTAFYSIETPDSIRYKYISFHFSILSIPLIIYALFLRNKSYSLRFDRIIVLIIIKDLYLYFHDHFNEQVDFDPSLYFVLIIGWAITTVMTNIVKDNVKGIADLLIDSYFLSAIGTMFLRIILGMSTFGRYGAIGLSVGGTGYFSSLYLIYLMYIHKYTQYTPVLISIAFLALILSGQRTNLFLVLFFIIPYLFSDVFQASNKNNKLFLHMFLVIFFLFVSFFLVIFGEQIMSSFETENFLTRILTTIQDFSDDTVSSDYSVDGRMRSIEAGLDILSETPTGISNCFYDLQFRMLELQFPTFPHSSLLSCLLLWSIPITLYCMYYLILLTIKLLIKRNGYFFVVLYILLIMIVWNGPFLDYPIVFITLFFISLATNSIHKSESLPQIEQMITSNKQNATT